MDFDPNSARLLIELGLQYTETGALQKLKTDLQQVASAAKTATSNAGQTIAQAAAQAHATAISLYQRAAQSLQQSGRMALAAMTHWGNEFSSKFKTIFLAVAANTLPVLQNMGRNLESGMKSLLLGLHNTFNRIGGTFSGLFSTIGGAFGRGVSAVGTVMTATASGMARAYLAAGPALTRGYIALQNAFNAASTGIPAMFARVGTGLMSGFSALGGMLTSAARSVGAGIAATTRGALNMAGSGARMAGNAVAAPFRAFAGGFNTGAPPPSIGQSGFFQNSMNMATDAMRNASWAATQLATYGIGALLVQFTSLAYGAKKVAEEFVAVNERFQGLEITLKSSFKSPEIARDFRNELARVTAQSPLPFEGIAQLTRSLAVMPQTRGRLMDQALDGKLQDPDGFLRKAVLLVEKMTTFRPDKTVADAVYSIREALGGEFRSLVRRFDIPVSIVSQLAGKSVAELKTDGSATIDALMKVFDKIVTTQAIQERAMQPSVVWQNIVEQIGTVGALKVGDAGIYPKIQRELGMLFDSVQELNRPGKDGGPSLVDKYSPAISKSLEGFFDSMKMQLGKTFEDLMGRLGFGQSDMPGASMVERSLAAVVKGIDALSVSLPKMFERVYNILSAVIPLLTKIGEIVVKVIDNLSSLFSSTPMAALGLMFKPTRVGMVAGAAGMNPALAMGLGVMSAPGLVRGIGNVVPNYGAGGSMIRDFGASFTNNASAAAGGAIMRNVTAGSVLRGVGGALSTLAVGALYVAGGVELLKALYNWSQEYHQSKIGQGYRANGDLEAYLTQNPEKAKDLRVAVRDYTNANTDIPADENGPAYSAADQKRDSRTRISEALKGFSKAQEVLDSLTEPQQTENIMLMASRVITAYKKGQLVIQHTSDQAATALALMEKLGGRFTDADNPAYNNLDEAFNSRAFKSTIAGAQPMLAQMQAAAEMGSSSHFRDSFQEFAKEIMPMAEHWKKIDEFLRDRMHALSAGQHIRSALGNTDALLSGQSVAQGNFKETLGALTEAKKNGMAGNTRLTKYGLAMELDEAIKTYSDIVESMTAGAGEMSEALRGEYNRIQVAVATSDLALKTTSLQAANEAFRETVEMIDKNVLVEGANATEHMNKLREYIQKLDPKLGEMLKAKIDAMEEALPVAGALDAKADEAAKAQIHQIAAEVQTTFADFFKKLAEAAKEGITNMLPKAVPTISYKTVTVAGVPMNVPQPTLPSGPGVTEGGDLFNIDPSFDSAVQSALNAGNVAEKAAGVEQQKADVFTRKTIKTGGTKRSSEDRMLDNATTNAMQEIMSVLSAAQNIHNEGPRMDMLKQQFSHGLTEFPELAKDAQASMQGLFNVVKDGGNDIDAMHEKLKATYEFSKRLASVLKQRGADAGKRGDASMKDRYDDAARRAQEDALSIGQELYDLEEKLQKPFTNFFEGMSQSFGSAKQALIELGDTGRQVGDVISRNLGSAFSDWVMGTKSAGEAFQSFATSVISELARMAAEAAAKQLLGLLINLGTSALVGSAVPNGGAVSGYSYSSATGYTAMAEGGQVMGGSGIRDDVPAMLMGGEYVLSRDAVSRIGVQNLDAINEGTVRGFAGGGYVDSSGFTAPSTDTASRGGDGSLTISIPVNINREGGSDEDRTKDEQQKRELARSLETMVARKIQEEMRPGGILRRN